MRLRRLLGFIVYYGLARHLPWSPRPGGRAAKALRGWCASLMLDRCGEAVNVEHGAWFGSGRDVELGDRADIGMDALVMGAVSIGADVMMAPRCVLIAQRHRTDSVEVPMNQQGFVPDRRIVVEDDVWIGTGVTLLPGVRVGHGSIVGAGAVVTRDVPPWSLAAGSPARVLRSRRSEESRQEWQQGRQDRAAADGGVG